MTLTTNGGSVFAGQEIFDIVKSYEGKTILKISGLVASIGTLISCGFDTVLISPAATFMIHNPTLGEVSGERKDMEQAAQLLKTVETTILDAYVNKTGLDKEGLAELMQNQTFMTAQEAIDYGFADGLVENTDKQLELVAAHDLIMNQSFISKLEQIMNKEKQETELAEAGAKARLRLLSLQEEKE